MPQQNMACLYSSRLPPLSLAQACLLILVSLSLLACSIKEDKPDTEQVPQTNPTTSRSSMDHGVLFQKLSSDLPKETFLFASADIGFIQSGLSKSHSSFLGNALKQKGPLEFSQGLGRLFRARLGVDPSSAHWVALGISERGGSVFFLGGPLGGLSKLPSEKIAGLDLKRGEEIWFFPIEEEITAIFNDPKDIEFFSKLRRDPSKSLSEGSRRDKIEAQIKQMGEENELLVIADLQAPKVQKLLNKGAFPEALQALEWGSVGFGRLLQFHLKGKPAEIQALSADYKILKKEMSSRAYLAEKKSLKAPLLEGIPQMIKAQLAGSFWEDLSPSFKDEEAHVVLDFEGSDPMISLYLGAAIALSYPAHLEQIRALKVKEAQKTLVKIGEGALIFYAKNDAFPTVDNTSDEDWPTGGCTTTGGLPRTLQQPDPLDFEVSPWSDLGITLSAPHYFRYCFQPVGEDRFFATAEASLKGGEEVDTILEIQGHVSNERPMITTPLEVSPP